MKLRTFLFAVLAAAITAAQAMDLSQPMILVAKPELMDQLYEGPEVARAGLPQR